MSMTHRAPAGARRQRKQVDGCSTPGCVNKLSPKQIAIKSHYCGPCAIDLKIMQRYAPPSILLSAWAVVSVVGLNIDGWLIELIRGSM